MTLSYNHHEQLDDSTVTESVIVRVIIQHSVELCVTYLVASITSYRQSALVSE